jgi:prophage regulatory protein
MQEVIQTTGEVLLRMPQVAARLGLGRSAIYDLVKRGELSPPIKLGARASAWPASVIDAFIAARIRGSQAQEGKRS